MISVPVTFLACYHDTSHRLVVVLRMKTSNCCCHYSARLCTRSKLSIVLVLVSILAILIVLSIVLRSCAVLHHHHQHHVAASDPTALLFHNNNTNNNTNTNHNESVAISFESHAIYSMNDRNHLNRHATAIAPPPPIVRMIPVARSLAEMYRLSSSSSSSSSSTTINHNIASSFCVPWNVVSDKWWTHHVEWTVFFEDDTHYCFERVRDAEKRAFLSSLYRLQFPLTTAKSKKAAQPGQQQEPHEPNDANPLCSNVLMKDMWSSGFSADMANVVDGLMRSRATQRPCQVTSREPWHYAVPKQQQQQQQRRSSAKATSAVAACPTQDMFCYFLPISSCPQQVPPTNEKNENATVVVQNDIFYPHLAFGNNDDETSSSSSSSKTARMRRNWYFEYATRLQTWMRKSVYDYTQHQIRTALPLQTPCTVMHVRRGDVVLHGASARRYHAIRDYINTTARRRYQMERNILLLTDDDNAIHEALTEFPNDMLHHWMYLNRSRYKAASGGFEQHLPSRNATLEMTILLSTLRLVRRCNSLIKSSSGFGTLILHEMRASNDSVWFVNVEDGYNYSNNNNNNNNDAGTAVSNHHNKNIHSVIFNAKNAQTVGVSKPYIIRAPPPPPAAAAAVK